MKLTKDFHRGEAEKCQQIAVPLCTKKDKRDKETGEKNSFFAFQRKNLKKQWIHAIRRDVGSNFHKRGNLSLFEAFQGEDLQRSLSGSGKVSPKTGAVPSKFAWKGSSPRKQPRPTARFTGTKVATTTKKKCQKLARL